MSMRWSRVVPLLLLLTVGGCTQVGFPAFGTNELTPLIPAPTDTRLPPIWVGTWGDAITNNEPANDNMGGSSRSFRFLVTPTIGGVMERVRFSNYYGKTPVVIGTARLSIGKDGTPSINPQHDSALSFNGQPGVTLAPGQVITSDPVSITFAFGQILAVSVYLPGSFGPVARHSSIFITNYTTEDGGGDTTANVDGTRFTRTLTDWLLISGVDVYGPYQGTLALFGSSTTDGTHANYSDTALYPTPNVAIATQHDSRLSDWMAKRLLAGGYRIGVVNLGIPGDTVTDDVSNATGHIENANQRIGHDVLTLPNLLGVISYFGSIDIRSVDCMSAPAIENATQQMAAAANAANVPLVLATLPPSAFCSNPAEANFGPLPSSSNPYAGGVSPGPANGGEIQRMAFNQWLRATGAQLPGVAGVADLDAGLLDPAHPSFLQNTFNSGDNQHLTGAGYKKAASLIPLGFLPAPPL